MLALFLAFIAIPGVALANDPLWALLTTGGQVVLIRHTITTPGVGDPPGMRLDDCKTQRNLTDEGIAHARRIGEEFRKRGIAAERVLASPWCRCIETAKLAFGKAQISLPLGNLFGRPENREKQVAGMQKLVGAWRGKGNLVLVSHGSTISALTGTGTGTGEMVVVTPKGAGKFEVAGRLSVP